MSEYLRALIQNAKDNGYVVHILPQKKRININGRGMYDYGTAKVHLERMLKVQ